MLLIKPPAPPPTASTTRAPQKLLYVPTPKALMAPEGPAGQTTQQILSPTPKQGRGGILNGSRPFLCYHFGNIFLTPIF